MWKSWSQGGAPVRGFPSVGESGRALVFSVEMERGDIGDCICRHQIQ